MLNTIYQLVRPRQFEVAFEDITIDREHVLVRPTHLSICNADERYYQGTRGMEVLQKKLPMALIHEGIGKVVYDPTGTFSTGAKVVMIPNVPTETDAMIAENYLRSSRFRGSSMHGFMQEYIQTSADRLAALPEGIHDLVAAFTEMITVCYHGISRFDRTAHPRREAVGIWGDGNMGYLTALLLKMRFPQTKVYVFGVTETKLSDFTFADGTWQICDIPEELQIDHGFECVGGSASGRAINQMIDHLNPEGTIGIFGVSEDLVPINTRMILEKGLKVLGTSRSGREDFLGLFALYQERPEVLEYLEKLIGAVVPVRGIPDMVAAFEMDIHKIMGKTVMVWGQ